MQEDHAFLSQTEICQSQIHFVNNWLLQYGGCYCVAVMKLGGRFESWHSRTVWVCHKLGTSYVLAAPQRQKQMPLVFVDNVLYPGK
jgi:hypothetical protein